MSNPLEKLEIAGKLAENHLMEKWGTSACWSRVWERGDIKVELVLESYPHKADTGVDIRFRIQARISTHSYSPDDLGVLVLYLQRAKMVGECLNENLREQFEDTP